MTTELDQRRNELLHELYCRWQTLDRYVGDQQGRDDIMRQIARVTEKLREYGVGRSEFAIYAAKRDEAERARRQQIAEQHYERTGTIINNER